MAITKHRTPLEVSPSPQKVSVSVSLTQSGFITVFALAPGVTKKAFCSSCLVFRTPNQLITSRQLSHHESTLLDPVWQFKSLVKISHTWPKQDLYQTSPFLMSQQASSFELNPHFAESLRREDWRRSFGFSNLKQQHYVPSQNPRLVGVWPLSAGMQQKFPLNKIQLLDMQNLSILVQFN